MVDGSDVSWDSTLLDIAVRCYVDLSADRPADVVKSFDEMRSLGTVFRPVMVDRPGEVVGFAAAVPRRVYIDPQMPSWQLWWLAVDPAHRRRGIATTLLAQVEAHAVEAGDGKIWLWTWERATAARATYEACGLPCVDSLVIPNPAEPREDPERHYIHVRNLHHYQESST